MSNYIEDQLEDVLDAFVAAGPGSLTDWIQRYPHYKRELIEFAASWQLSESLPTSPDAEPVSDAVILEHGKRAVQDLLRTRNFDLEPVASAAGSAASVPIRSLIEEARARGLRPRQFAAATGMGENLLAKLDRGLIRFASIPREAFESLAAALQRDLVSIQTYLEQKGPTVASVAAFKAEQTPEAGEPEDFVAAVQTDSTMSPDQRRRWLEISPPSDR
jgi:hypothetical protein